MRSILITGGAGFVGRNMIRYIRQTIRDAVITVVDDLSADPNTFWVQGLDEVIDYFTGEDVRSYFEYVGAPVDLCIHLASIVGGRLTIENNPILVARNLAIDAAVIEAAHRGKFAELMYFSSSAVYPVDLQGPDVKLSLHEQLVDLTSMCFGMPDMTYGWSKLTGEYLCSFLTNTKVTIFRPFSGYGTDQSPNYPFKAILDRIQGGHDPIVVWGSGEQQRDFIHIHDVCRMAFALHDGQDGGTFNLATGQGTSFIGLATLAQQLLKVGGVIEPDPTKPEGVFKRIGNPGKAASLGVKSEISLVQGIDMWARGEL